VTPGPWAQGRTLRTRQTATWHPSEIAENEKIEQRKVFANFTSMDEGRSRRLVALCERAEDAQAIAAMPDLVTALLAFISLDPTFKSVCDAQLNELANNGNAMAIAVRLARAALAKAGAA
jgi:hypothetical protein